MDVNGVRISWDMALSRLALVFSFSTSSRICSCFLILVVNALTQIDTASMVRNVMGYPVIVKFNAK